jgi:hypothetical protein
VHSSTACAAMRNGVCLEVRYDGYMRIVEVHTVGATPAGHDVMRVWQVRGGSIHNEPVGWKLLRLDEVSSLRLLTEASRAPRAGYKRADRAMQTIYCQV